MSNAVKNSLVHFLVMPCLTLSCPALSRPVLPCPALPCSTLPCPALPYAKSDLALNLLLLASKLTWQLST